MRWTALALSLVALSSTVVSLAGCASPEESNEATSSGEDDIVATPDGIAGRRLPNGRLVIHPTALPDPPEADDPADGEVQADGAIDGSEWRVDLSPRFQPVRDQGQTNTCESFAFTSIVEAELGVHEYLSVEPVRKQLVLFGTDGNFDFVAGTRLNGLHIMKQTLWPFGGKAAPEADAHAAAQITGSDLVLPSPTAVIRALDAGKPLQFAICFDPKFAHGPTSSDLTLTGSPSTFGRRFSCAINTALGKGGGHAVVIVGYKEQDGSHVFKFRNSWGEDWGEGGYGRMGEGFLRKMGYVGHTVDVQIDSSRIRDFK